MSEEAEAEAALAPFDFVDAAAKARLVRFAALLRRWQATHNLVSRSSLDELWSRHIADSVQLVPLAPPFRQWVDIGSGGGFPGLVVAIVLAEQPDHWFTLVEANQKKSAFLRAAIRETGAHAEVASERIETHSARMAGQADVVSARALAPFAELAGLAFPYLSEQGVLLMLKGQEFDHEEREASRHWSYALDVTPSRTDPAGRIVAVRRLRPRTDA
ncbi:16S rRNA (guanine(527)-N(7))-methyltransferase RsmG [Faunimonas sp. B44]|uniref:16S rRNA (guanine(527)-N(7))-methyltransferase RsmG n=1 Tax=Faunimonas sp. B44 TaxID=3461493 RepID=UPI0040446BB7